MAKELTREDRIKKQYSELVKLNQRLKNISSCYYIHSDGMVYMKALVPFTEVVIRLRYPEKIDLFTGAMILPNEFFQFTKDAKKTKMNIKEYEEDGTKKFLFGQSDDTELEYTLNIVNQDSFDSFEGKKFLHDQIIPKMYKRYFELESDLYIQCEDKDVNYKFTEEDTDGLAKSSVMFLDFNGTQLTITRNLFLDLKKGDKLSISRNCYQKVEKNLCRMFYIISHETDIYNSYTTFNILQQIPK